MFSAAGVGTGGDGSARAGGVAGCWGTEGGAGEIGILGNEGAGVGAFEVDWVLGGTIREGSA